MTMNGHIIPTFNNWSEENSDRLSVHYKIEKMYTKRY